LAIRGADSRFWKVNYGNHIYRKAVDSFLDAGVSSGQIAEK